MDPAIVARFPSLGEPGLEIECRPVDANESALHQHRKDLGRLVAGDEAIEGSRLPPQGDDDLSTALARFVRRFREAAGER